MRPSLKFNLLCIRNTKARFLDGSFLSYSIETPMKKHLLRLSVLLFFAFLFFLPDLISRQDEAVRTVEQYLQGLVEHNSNLVSNLSCSAWEQEALMEVDSFQLVSVSLQDVNCRAVGEDPEGITVNCSGAIVTSYNNELMHIALDQRNFLVKQENGDGFVCGYR